MKNKLFLAILFFVCLFLNVNNANADYDAVFTADSKCALHSSATGNCFYKMNEDGLPNYKELVSGTYWLDTGDKIVVIEDVGPFNAPEEGYGSDCKSTYSYVSILYNNKTYKGFACTDNIKKIEKSELIEENFPESYWKALNTLKTTYPNWKFIPVDTGLKFSTAVSNEDSGNKSLIQYTSSVNSLGYLSTADANYNWKTDKYKVYDGSNWYAANRDTIAYFMDPRNFLTVNYIWMFEGLSFDETTQTEEVVKALLSGQYIERYALNFINAGKKTNVSAVYLASLSRQEVGGTSANTAITGKKFTYDGKTYSGVYNFYNIGATSGSDGLAVYRGLVYANGGSSGSGTSYNRPWTTPDKAILGGAEFIAKDYIQYGQITSYFKKWDVVKKFAQENGYTVTGNYSHQYMQNIQAPRSEASTTYKSYQSLKMVDTPRTFYIPIYESMPDKTSLPNKNSPNNYLKTLTLNINNAGATQISGWDADITSYKINVEDTKSSVVIGATTVRSDAKVTGTGTKTLAYGDNKYDLVVTAANGNTRTYSITINRAEPTGTYKTIEQIITESKINLDGDYITGLSYNYPVTNFSNIISESEPKAIVKVTRDNKEITTGNIINGDVVEITSGPETKKFIAVVFGDVNRDGRLSSVDLAMGQKHILNISKLTGAQLKCIDINHDGRVSSVDLAMGQKQILGKELFSQK